MTDLFGTLSTALADLDPLRLALILLTILGAAVVKGAIGFGFPLAATPIISAVWDPRHAVLLLSLAALVNNVGVATRGGGSRRTFRRLLPTMAGVVAGTVVGALVMASIDARLLGIVVGGATVIFGIVGLVNPDLAVPPHVERKIALPVGLAGGLLGGSTSIFAPVLASYVFAIKLAKRELVFFLSLMYLVGGIVQVITFVRLGLYDAPTLTIALVSIVPNVLGVMLGLRLQDWIDPISFRRLVVFVIMLTGLSLVVRGLWP